MAEQKAVSIGMKDGKAKVTHLQGKAFLVKEDLTTMKQLARNDLLSQGSRVRTGKDSRIELKLPDGSYIRFDEQTTFVLEAASFNKKEKKRNISIKMALGKTWARVSRFLRRRGRFTITTKTAVAGVRGTVYRMNVNQDDSVMIKVYWGEILVNSLKQADTAAKKGIITKPSKVSGPHPIPGPHKVSMEEWTYILKAMQQININPDGTATKPFRFSIKDDLNDWVRWNQKLDEKLSDQER